MKEEAQIIQGLNLDSDTSITVLEMKKSNDVIKLLKLINNFHPIFLKSYKFTDEKLLIESKLPFLWEDMAETLIQLSKEEITYRKAKTYCLEKVIRLRIKSMSTIPVLYTAQSLLYEITPTLVKEKEFTLGVSEGYSTKWNRNYTIGTGKGSQHTLSISSSKDSAFANGIQKDKWSTNKFMEKIGLPVPRWEVVKNRNEIEAVWNNYEKPIVLKPTGLTAGAGVTTNIKTLEKAYKAFERAQEAVSRHKEKTWQQKIMIQEQVEGDKNGADYRLLTIDGELKVCTKRIPAFVTGDGKSTIQTLIENENKDPRRDINNPAHILKPIEIDKPLTDLLQSKGLSLSSIPQKEKQIYVRNVASMSRGGITEDYTDKVAPEIKLMVESIAKSTKAFVLGIDIIAKDISKPLTKDNGGILEINTMPEAYLNIYPVIGQEREDAIEFYIKRLLKDNSTKQIVVVGNYDKDIPTLLKQNTFLKQSYLGENDVIGEYKDKEIRINGLTINKNIEKRKAMQSLKLNGSLDAIIIQHRDWEDVRKYGLGFDRIDLLLITSKSQQEKSPFNTIKRYRRKGLINNIKIL